MYLPNDCVHRADVSSNDLLKCWEEDAAALVRRQGGNDAVGHFYLAMGNATHEAGAHTRDEAVLQGAIGQALQAGGFSTSLQQQAAYDSTTRDDVLVDHTEAKTRFGAYAVPWLVVGDQQFGFNGPIMTEVPRGETARELWQHLSWLYRQPYFYEVKRERR